MNLRLPTSLRSRILLLVGLAILPTMALLTFNGLERRRSEAAALRAQTLNFARLAAEAEEGRLEGARQLLLALSRSSEIRGGDWSRCAKYVQSFTANPHSIYTFIGVADRSGAAVCHTRANEGPFRIDDRPYFKRAVESGTFAVGDFMTGRKSGRPAVGFAYPLRDAAGAPAGVVFAGIDLNLFSHSLRTSRLSSDATITIVDRTGTIIARSVDPERWIGTRASERDVRTMAQRQELVTEFKGPDGINRMYAVSTIRDQNGAPVWFAVVGVRRDVIMAAADRRLRTELATLAALGLVILAAAWVGAEGLLRRPITQLMKATDSLAAGELQTRAPTITGIRELGELARAFNDMAERLEHRDVHLRQGQRLEAVGQLAGGIAHDFNNVLTVIIGSSESLMGRASPGSEDAAELTAVLDAAHRAAKLTQQLLAFSSRQRLQPAPIDLNASVAQMHAMLVRVIGEDIRLLTNLDPEAGIVHADLSQLEQVVMNLVVNARDAMPGGGTVSIETRRVGVGHGREIVSPDFGALPPGSYVALIVSDTGTGIDEAARAHIFEPFFSTKGAGGSGLGLATVYGIVKQSGGFITCDSASGRGTTFTIFLPRQSQSAGNPRPSASPASTAAGNERVVLVEDETPLRLLIERVLTRHGYEVRATGEPLEALQWFHDDPHAVDLLITDVVMPGMSGPALYQAIKASRPDLKVLFVSGYTHERSGRATVPSDAVFLQKPFGTRTLLEHVRIAIDRAVRV